MRSENGFTAMAIELMAAVAIMGLIGTGAASTIYQLIHTTRQSNEHMTAVQYVENAGYWVTSDTCMADTVIADNMTSPQVLILKWTDWGYGTSNVYYTSTYSIENVVGGVGQLKRRLQSSSGTDRQTVVSDRICYDPADQSNSTNITYQSPMLNLRVAARFGSYTEVRQYQVYQRPNF